MKNKGVWGVFLALFTTITYAQAQQDTQKIETAVDELYAAMVDKNEESLKNLTAEALTYGHSSGKIEDKAQYVEGVMNGSFDFSSITPAEQNIAISGDTAIVRHIFVAEGTDNGKPADVRIGVMMTYLKQNGQWKLLARQAYKLP